jgi:hypothetical protein
LVAALKALTELWSWLTTQTRSTPVGRSSKAMFPEIAGRFAVSGQCTSCTKVVDCVVPPESRAVTMT